MQKTILALALAAGFAAPAFAEDAPAGPHTFTANAGVVTDYVFRGISQSQHQPAVQGGVDYSHSSGFYAGTWASTIEWVDRKDLQVQKDNHLEVDLYGGYKNTVGDFGYDLGAIRYYYPGSFNTAAGVTANTTEVYVAGSWKFVSLKYNHVVSQNIFNWGGTDSGTKTRGSGYYDLTVTYPIDETLNVIGHVGRQNIHNLSAASYTDYKIGVTKDVGFGVVGLSYTDTNAKGGVGQAYRWANKDVSNGVVALSFTKTFNF
ncbi:MAG: TorF family putative porin [Actinomycetota bacterium]